MKDREFDIIADLSLYIPFILVCNNGSFSKTADILGVTQPSVSYSIKKLEDELGVLLFERGSILTMTPEASELLPYIEEAINSIQNGERKISDLVALKSGVISIGIPSHIGVFFLTEMIKKFNLKYPNVCVKTVCKPTNDLVRLLRLNEIDIVIDSSPLPENISDLIIYKIASEKCAFACSSSNLELLKNKLNLEDLSRQKLIVPSSTSSTTKRLKEVFMKNNVKFTPLFEINTSDMISAMVEMNIGIGFLFEKTIDKYSNLRKLEVDCNMPEFEIFLIYKPRILSQCTQKFIDMIVKNKNI